MSVHLLDHFSNNFSLTAYNPLYSKSLGTINRYTVIYNTSSFYCLSSSIILVLSDRLIVAIVIRVTPFAMMRLCDLLQHDDLDVLYMLWSLPEALLPIKTKKNLNQYFVHVNLGL